MRVEQKKSSFFVVWFIVLSLIASGCGAPASQTGDNRALSVLATTTIVADVVKNVGGEYVQVSSLLPVGLDPHSFQPTPQDVAKVADADLLFTNGAGLEEFLNRMLKNTGAQVKIVPVSEGVTLLAAQEETHAAASADGGDHAYDPHTWFDPNNVELWTDRIAQALSELDPAHAQNYAANAGEYKRQLQELDAWIQAQVAQVPLEKRKLVTDHSSFTYFANRYGFEQVGAVMAGYSTLAEPSAQELARLEDLIHAQGVSAIFVSENTNVVLSERVAQDTGIRVVKLYNGSLSGPDGPAATYLEFMRYDVTQIIDALR